jgi:hypothetical protein
MYRLFSVILILLFLKISYSQDTTNRILGDTIDMTDDNAIEKIIESQTQDAEDSRLLDILKNLESNPVNLNTATQIDLERIPYINAVISKRIIDYRRKINNFKSISELKYIDGIDKDLYNNIKRFVIVKGSKFDFKRDNIGNVYNASPSTMFRNFSFQMRNRFTNDLQLSKGYIDTNYLGSKPKIYNRFRLQFKPGNYSIDAGFLSEKDAGEPKFFDYISGYIQFKSNTFLEKAILGDYTLEFGEGISLWSSLAFSKGSDAVMSVKKSASEIDAYTSVNEVQYYRGASAKFKYSTSYGSYSLFGFYSYNTFDATVDSSQNELSTYYVDGYHRTQSEINRKDASKEKLFGGRLLFENPWSKFGITYYKSNFDKSFKQDDVNDFSGDKSEALGFDYDIVIKNLNLFGEWARSYNKAIGGVSGLKILLFSKSFVTDLAFLVRYYPADFMMIHSYGFGEKSDISKNEFGIYSGITIKVPGLVRLDAYYDQYKFPYKSYYVPVPAAGNDLLVYSEWKLSNTIKLFTKFKSENKEDVIDALDEYGKDIKKIYTRSQKNYRFQFDYDVSKTFRIRSRVEYCFVDYMANRPSEKGLIIFSDFRIRPFKDISIDGRFIVFQTDSYDSRIYEYENELEGVVSNQGLYDKGYRWYFMIKYKPFNFVELSARYSETTYDGVKSIGSGNDEIMGDTKNRLSLQLEMKF